MKRRKALGDLSALVGREQNLDDLARDWYELHAEPNLADNTLEKYRRMLRQHILPELGQLKLADITPEVVARFRTDLERRGVGRDSVRVSLVGLQAMFRRGIEWGRASTNPAVPVAKPSGKRERAVQPFSPAQVERIRAELEQEDAALVAAIAYSGQRCPEEILATEWRHVRERTLLVEQRNLDGELTAGQKVKGAAPRAVDLITPLRQDLLSWRLASGRPPGTALVFPRADGRPWRRHDWNTGGGGSGSPRSSGPRSTTRRRMTCATPSRHFRSGPECRSRPKSKLRARERLVSRGCHAKGERRTGQRAECGSVER